MCESPLLRPQSPRRIREPSPRCRQARCTDSVEHRGRLDHDMAPLRQRLSTPAIPTWSSFGSLHFLGIVLVHLILVAILRMSLRQGDHDSESDGSAESDTPHRTAPEEVQGHAEDEVKTC